MTDTTSATVSTWASWFSSTGAKISAAVSAVFPDLSGWGSKARVAAGIVFALALSAAALWHFGWLSPADGKSKAEYVTSDQMAAQISAARSAIAKAVASTTPGRDEFHEVDAKVTALTLRVDKLEKLNAKAKKH